MKRGHAERIAKDKIDSRAMEWRRPLFISSRINKLM